MTELKNTILETLKKQNIHMIPKWKLFLYSCGFIFALVFLFLVVVFILSFIFFTLSRYGILYMPLFSFMTSLHVLQSTPIFLLFVTILLLVLIEIISRKFTFRFRRPLLVTLVSTTSAAVIISALIGMTPIHEYVRDYAEEHNIPLMFKAYKRPPVGKGDVLIIRGQVSATSSDSITVKIFDGSLVTGVVSSTTRGHHQSLGSDILLFGKMDDTVFMVKEIKKAPFGPFEKRRGNRMMDHDGEGRYMPSPDIRNEIKVLEDR